jgi:hypothetical protein
MFYKTAYKIGLPVLAAVSAAVLFAGAAEVTAAAVPALNGVSGAALVRQLPVLAAGLAAFALLSWLAYRISARRFERVDL